MTNEEEYKLRARIAVQRHLIKELLAIAFAQARNPIEALEGFKQRTIATLERTTIPIPDPALSDAMMQEMTDVARRILEETQQALVSLLSQRPPTDQAER